MGKYTDIPIGKENAITRAELALKWDMRDREVRKKIAELRAEDNGDDYIIVAFSSGKGYYRTNDRDKIRHFRNEMSKRARNTFAPLDKANRILSKAEGQIEGMDFLNG